MSEDLAFDCGLSEVEDGFSCGTRSGNLSFGLVPVGTFTKADSAVPDTDIEAPWTGFDPGFVVNVCLRPVICFRVMAVSSVVVSTLTLPADHAEESARAKRPPMSHADPARFGQPKPPLCYLSTKPEFVSHFFSAIPAFREQILYSEIKVSPHRGALAVTPVLIGGPIQMADPALKKPGHPIHDNVVAKTLATGYLRLLRRHGPNWREHLQLRGKPGAEESSKKYSNRLDFSANKSMKYAGKRTITLTLTRS